jgi:hypothetical protein
MSDPIRDPDLEQYFQSIGAVPERDPARIEEGKRVFLEEARLAKTAVSKMPDSRLNLRTTFGKERIAMWKTAGALMIAIGALLGGGGAVVAGAQEAMPEDTLYPVKIWSEDVCLWADGDPLSKMNLALEFADRRAEEIVHDADSNLPVADAILARLMEQDDLALTIAAQTGDAEAPAALEMVRTRLEEHLRVLDYLQAGAGPDESAQLLQTRQNIRQRLELLNGDLHDQQLRIRILEQVRDRENRPEVTPAGQTNQNGNEDAGQGAGSDAAQGSGGGSDSPQGSGPQADGTPAPGGGNGEGQDPEATCECQDVCSGQGAGGDGNGPGATAPAGKSDEGTCVCPPLACTPQKGNQNKTGNP